MCHLSLIRATATTNTFSLLSSLISSFFATACVFFWSMLLSLCICSSIFDMFFFLLRLFIFQMFLKGIVLIWFRFYWHCCRMASADIDRRIANGCTNVRICKCVRACAFVGCWKKKCEYTQVYTFATIFSLYGCSDNRNGFKVLLLWCFLCSFHLHRLHACLLARLLVLFIWVRVDFYNMFINGEPEATSRAHPLPLFK